MKGLLSRLVSKTPMHRYVQAVQEGTRQQQAEADRLGKIADVHSVRLEGFFDRNHFSVLVDQLITPGPYKKGPR